MKILKKELIVFFAIFFILAFFMHLNSWLSYPIEQIKNLPRHVFPWHPLVYTCIVYIVVWFFRFTFGSLFKKK